MNIKKILRKFSKSNDENKTYCRICEKRIKLFKESEINFKAHMQRMHKKSLELYSLTLIEDNMSDVQQTNIPPERLIFLKLCSKSTIEDVGFRTYSNDLMPGLLFPSRSTILKDMKNLEHKILAKIVVYFSECISFSLGIDMWSYNNKSVIATVAQLSFEHKNNKLISIDISVINNHQSITITKYLVELSCRFNMSIDKCVSICSDNAFNMIKSINDFINTYKLENDVTEIESDQGGQDIIQYKEVPKNITLFHDGCFLHKLQLCILDASKKCDYFIQLVNKSVEIVKILKKAGEERIYIQLPCITRWNSTYLMLDSLLKNKEKILKLSENNVLVKNIINRDITIWQDLKNIVPVLHSVYLISSQLERNDYYFSNIKNKIIKLKEL